MNIFKKRQTHTMEGIIGAFILFGGLAVILIVAGIIRCIKKCRNPPQELPAQTQESADKVAENHFWTNIYPTLEHITVIVPTGTTYS